MDSPDKDMDSPAISRSGRVLKKSTKLKEMEDLDIPELEAQLKQRKKAKGLDELDEFDDKRIAPIKIPKISLNVSSPSSSSFTISPTKKRIGDMLHSSTPKIPPFPSPVKSKLDPNRPLFQESSADEKGSSSSETSSTTTTSSSSSDESDVEIEHSARMRATSQGKMPPRNIHHSPSPHEKVIVEPYRQAFNSPLTFVDQNNELSMYASEEETSESNLVIAEESNDMRDLMPKEKKGSAAKRKPVKKGIVQRQQKPKPPRKKPPAKETKMPAARKKPVEQAAKEKKLTAYSLWCAENRRRIQSQNPMIFSSISKKMGEIWQALPEKEKMAWRRKAKKMAQKGGSIISTGRQTEHTPKPMAISPATTNHSSLNASSPEDSLRNSADSLRSVGTSPIDVAAYLKLLGESLSIIGQRLTEHEGQIAVSGIFSVLLDSTLCALGPLLCLTSEAQEMNGCSQPTLSRMLDNIAYFMPGL